MSELTKLLEALEVARSLVAEIPCQQMMAIEDCNVAVATHVLHPDRYEKVPRSEWCERCAALDTLDRAALAQAERPEEGA